MICRILGEIHVRILAGQLGSHLRLDDATDVCSHAVLRSPSNEGYGKAKSKFTNTSREHPKMGKLKTCIRPYDITINIGNGGPIPECPFHCQILNEILNFLNVSGLPPHYLPLKIRRRIILLRNIDHSNGLCNDKRLIFKGFK
ncbi:hypothetical protein LXL04_013892 [Taraxacum kok-saghyz]